LKKILNKKKNLKLIIGVLLSNILTRIMDGEFKEENVKKY